MALEQIPEGFSFVISWAIWRRGDTPSRLLMWGGVGEKREQCCVGICLTALGVPDSELLAEPVARYAASSPVERELAELIGEHLSGPSDGAHIIYALNDMDGVSDREAKIAAAFKTIGITVTFED